MSDRVKTPKISKNFRKKVPKFENFSTNGHRKITQNVKLDK